VTEVPLEQASDGGEERAVRVSAVPGAPPLGAIFGGIGVLAAAVVGALGLDRLPLTFCVFKGLSGLPCPTCGSTRTVARLFDLDPAGALAMNPFTTIVAVVLAAWAVVDLLLLPSRRALRVGFSPRLGRVLRIAALVAFMANWVYLLAMGR
jgi:hypothetical protein